MEMSTEQMAAAALKSGRKSYYYPSEREPACWGKGAFMTRFPLMDELESISFCAKFCAFFCYFLKHERRNIPKDEVELERLLPVRTPKFSSADNAITYTWIGHSTAVLSIGRQANIIIDPVFSQRASPFQWIGPQRYRPPACEVDSLPPIHGVFVSHDHYDHLD
jgi:hypothetical protein